MRLERVQEALKKKAIDYSYSEEDEAGSIDFLFKGIRYHVWEVEDNGWSVETNIQNAGRDVYLEGDYEEVIVKEILSWPDMIQG